MADFTDKILYLDCFSGISGDMMLGALIDLGVPLAVVESSLVELQLPGVSFSCEPVMRGSLRANKWRLHESQAPHGHAGHHHHDHHHVHYAEIRARLQRQLSSSEVLSLSLGIFDRIAAVEAQLHGVAVEQVSFHEVGAVDSIVDIVGIAAALAWLKPREVISRTVPLGGGNVMTAHGLMPVPAPATLELLRHAKVTGGDAEEGELVTPTGAAILACFVTRYVAMPEMKVVATGWGAGDRNPPGRTNALRLVLGESQATFKQQSLLLIETNLDDMNPQFFEHIFERLFRVGALDVWIQAATMKKGRPAQVLSVLCDDAAQENLISLLFSETSSLGVRTQRVNRLSLERKFVGVASPWGEVSVKVGFKGDQVMNVAPEYEDCRRIAREHDIPIKVVYDTVRALFKKA